MAQLQAQPSINDARTQAHLALGARLAQIDLTPLLVYRIDSVPASALPHLAWQFDVLSPLWQLLAPGGGSVAQSATRAARDLIKLAISLHRVRGTPYAIKTALAALGWPSAKLLEGQSSWGGNAYPASQGWAVFRVQIPIADTYFDLTKVASWSAAVSYAPGNVVSLWVGPALLYYIATGTPAVGVPPQYASIDAVQNVDAVINWDMLLTQGWVPLGPQPPEYRPVGADDANTITQAALFFKPARAWLDSVWFIAPPVSDAAPAPLDFTGLVDNAPAPADVITAPVPPVSDNYGPIAPLYNNHYYHAGITYGAGEPTVADSGVTVNGQAISANG